MTIIERSAGRSTFGGDPETYNWARPEYPDEIYRTLESVCGLKAGTQIFEIGPGTGIATRKLLALGARVTAVEPDPRLAAYLESSPKSDTGGLRVVSAAFEDVVLPQASFDLGVSATAFHWLEQAPALIKVRRLLRPGGWWAMWWATHYDPGARNAFDAAIAPLFAGLMVSPSQGGAGELPFELDAEARTADLIAAGFSDVRHKTERTMMSFDTRRLVALFGTFSPILHLPADRRAHFLSELGRITDEQFGGKIERPLLLSLYLARC